MNFNNIILALLQLAEIGRDTIFKIFNSVDISVLSEDDFFDCVKSVAELGPKKLKAIEEFSKDQFAHYLKEANKIIDEPTENINKEIINIKKLHNFFSENRLPSIAFLSISLIIFSFIIIFQLFLPDKIKTNFTMKKETNSFQVDDNTQNQSGNFVKEIENLKKEDPIKNTNLNMDDDDYSSNFQNNNISFKEILATEDVWLEIKDINGTSMIATLLKKNETFSIPNEKGLTITLSNAGVVKIKNGDILSSEIGSFGTILNSVSLDSLLNKY